VSKANHDLSLWLDEPEGWQGACDRNYLFADQPPGGDPGDGGIPAFAREKEEKKLPNTPTNSDAKLRPALSLRPQFGAGCGLTLGK
jgi:hypothetical protein